jgi:hypothetical protein
MPKARTFAPAVSASDIAPSKASPLSATRQRGATPTDELVSLGFKLPPAFIREFKQGALDQGMKLNEFLIYLFREFRNSRNRQ